MPASTVGASNARVTGITGARYATGPNAAARGALQISGGRIQSLRPEPLSAPVSVNQVDLTGFLLLPGFINAHDHLQYALHPKLGRPPYHNYVEWGEDIHANLHSVISHYNSVPKDVRLWWGGIRNLLCGVTTVCHHDPLWSPLRAEGYPVTVLSNYGWAHSVRLTPSIRQAWSATKDDSAFFVHACEGTDEWARKELAELDRLRVLDRKTVIVHGLGLDEVGIALLRERQASLILCLSSNLFLYNCLPEIERMSTVEKIALGNDSPLTATGDLLDEARFAIEHGSISTDKTYRMITDLPSTILRLTKGEGTIRKSGCADLVAVRDNGEPPHCRLAALSWRDVELVMVRGEIRLASQDVWRILPESVRSDMEPLWIDNDIRWLRAPVRRLLRQAEAVLGPGMVRLGGHVLKSVDLDMPLSTVTPCQAATRIEESA